MTRDGRFKREVRRMARASGEPYSRVRARLEASRRRHDAPRDEPRWIAAFTFAGAEEWARDWLASRHADTFERVLVPRYEGQTIVPGMLLFEVADGATADLLVRLPQLTAYRGEPAAPERLTWDGVRKVLREEQQAARRARRGGAMEDFGQFREPVPRARLAGRRRGEAEDRALHRLLEQYERAPTVDEREEAKATVLAGLDPLVRYLVERFVAASTCSRADLLEAGRHGLTQAIEQFSWARGVGFRAIADTWVRRALAERMARSA